MPIYAVTGHSNLVAKAFISMVIDYIVPKTTSHWHGLLIHQIKLGNYLSIISSINLVFAHSNTVAMDMYANGGYHRNKAIDHN